MKPRVLFVDDEPNVLAALQRTVRIHLRDRARFEFFTDTELALLRLQEYAFDVVVSDFRMPRKDGIEFLGQVRGVQPSAVPLIVSGSSDTSTLIRAVNEARVFRYILKPWADAELISSLSAALDHAEAQKNQTQLADAMRVQCGDLSPSEAERRRLEALEPGITHVEWGPNGEVLMPPLS